MPMLLRLILAALLGLPAVAWPDTPAVVPDVHVGDFWQYRTTDGFTGEATLEFSHRIADINDREILVQLQNKGAQGKRELRYFSREWNLLDDGGTKFDPYYPEFKFPITVGVTWRQGYRTTNTSGQSSSSISVGKVVAFEKITIPAGAFDTYKIENDVESTGTDAN